MFRPSWRLMYEAQRGCEYSYVLYDDARLNVDVYISLKLGSVVCNRV